MPELRVGLDVSPLAQTRAGTARYLNALLAALEDRADIDVARHSFAREGRAATLVRDSAWYLAVLPALARRAGVDVLHCPTFRAPFHSPVPLVVTFHDVAVLRYPAFFNRWTRNYSAFAVPRVARAATTIVAVSQFTRREVVDLLGVPDERVRTIPNGVGPPFSPKGPATAGEYVLAVSTLEPRKNLPRLVDAFRRARLDGCELRVVGARAWGRVDVHGEKVRWVGEVNDEELAALYRGARCAAYVSLYEGFGLPVLEAMACGTAVVASDLPAIREFADGVAVTVDPLEPDAIAAGLEEAVERREELGARGLERAARFPWSRVADETLEVYREAAA